MSTMYFVADSRELFNLLMECHCKNILISYFYMKKVGNISWVWDQVDKLFVDSGAHTAYMLGKEIHMDDYYDYLVDNKGSYTIAAHFDVVDNLKDTVINLQHAMNRGIDWLMPVLQTHWGICLSKFNSIYNFDYFGLGGSYMFRKKLGYSLVDAVKRLPRKKKYHGFAKVNFDLLKKGYLYSADSSSWVAGARFGSAGALERDFGQTGIDFKRKDNQRMQITRLFQLHKDDCDACGLTLPAILSGDNDALSKAYIALYYRPKMKKMGLFKDNFFN